MKGGKSSDVKLQNFSNLNKMFLEQTENKSAKAEKKAWKNTKKYLN